MGEEEEMEVVRKKKIDNGEEEEVEVVRKKKIDDGEGECRR